MKKIFLLSLVMLLSSIAPALAENYVTPEQFKQWIETAKPVQIVDIQTAEDFAKHHFKNSLQTNAYPAKSDGDKQRLDLIFPTLQASSDDIAIVCPRGGGGAKNTYEYLKARGIPENRLYILEKGVAGWPYPAMLEKSFGE